MRNGAVLVFLAVGTLLASCDRYRSSDGPVGPPAAQLFAASGGESTQGGAADLSASWAQRKLIRTAEVDLKVGSVETTILAVQRIAQEHSGLVAGSKTTRGAGDDLHASMTVRVPSDRLDSALSELTKLGQIRNERVSSDDVTKAYFDLETRLGVKRETEGRLRDLLRTRTGQLSQVLEVERELDRVVGQIEQMEGERRYFDQQIAVSVITIEISEHQGLIRAGAFSNVRDAMGASIEVLSDSLAALVYITFFLVPWLLSVSLVWWIVAALKRRRSRSQRAA